MSSTETPDALVFSCQDLKFLSECQIPAAWVTDPDTHRFLADRMRPRVAAARARGESDLLAFFEHPIAELGNDTLAHWIDEGLPRVVAEHLMKILDHL